jgi:outer membrane protein assembly factor BamB
VSRQSRGQLPDATVSYDCGFFTDADTQIDCSGPASTCVNLCRNGANIWNTDLPGRFTFIEDDDSVDFCDTEDGKVSIGGTTELCDGSNMVARPCGDAQHLLQPGPANRVS